MKDKLIEFIHILIAIFFCCLAAEADDEATGEQKQIEAVNVINAELDDPEGLVRPWFMPKGNGTDTVLRLGIKALCAWEKKLGFFAKWKGFFGGLASLLSSVSSVSA